MEDLSSQAQHRDSAAPRVPRGGLWKMALRTAGVTLIIGLGLAVFYYPIFDTPPAFELTLTGRLVVLPVVNATGDPVHDWVRLGLMEMMAETLAENSGVQVVAPERLSGAMAARGLDPHDGEVRERIRELALALGAEQALDVVVRETVEGYSFEVRLFTAGGQSGESVELQGRDPVEIADRMTYSLARELVGGFEPVRMTRVFSQSPFLNRLYGMGLDALRTSGPELARPYFEIILRHQPRFPEAKARLAECELLLGELQRSRALELEVLEEAQNRGAQRLQAHSLQSLALVATLDGRIEQADRLHSQAQSIALAKGDRATELAVLHELARLAQAQGERERTEELLFAILDIEQDLGDRLGRADTLIQLGSLALLRGDHEAAEERWNAAGELARDLADEWTGMRVLTHLGDLARERGQLDEAEERWLRALAFFEQRGDRPQQLLLTRNVAEALVGRGDLESAEERLRQLLELAQELEDEDLEALASLQLTRILLRQGYPRQARGHLDRALELDRLIDDRVELQRLIAWLAYEQGNYPLAVGTQTAARRQSGDSWQEADEQFLRVFERALEENRRLPLPGEEGWREP
ncbi:MAG: tetratricopeptide repeat protein [bacterium]|nr:tetratricopeptide repeat protein [bacterium]